MDAGTAYQISIHAPRGGSDCAPACRTALHTDFNPRSPWGERPRAISGETEAKEHFNPRSPWGERPKMGKFWIVKVGISIHAPRGGSDPCLMDGFAKISHFNPRSPWGERQQRCTDFSVNLWQKCIFSECFLRKSPGYSGWIFGKPLFLPQKFLRTSREFLGASASHGGRLTISQRISVSSGR